MQLAPRNSPAPSLAKQRPRGARSSDGSSHRSCVKDAPERMPRIVWYTPLGLSALRTSPALRASEFGPDDHDSLATLWRSSTGATLLDFVVRYERVEIHRSARRHGVVDDDITHAIAHRLVIDDLGEEPDRWLVIGPDRAGNLLEIVVLISSDGDEFVIHAMSMRPKYRKLLES